MNADTDIDPATTTNPVASAPLTARGARTRAGLVKAARALFERQGYLDTNVGDIAKRAASPTAPSTRTSRRRRRSSPRSPTSCSTT